MLWLVDCELCSYRNASNKRPGRLLIFLRKKGAFNRGGVYLKNSISPKDFVFLSD